MKVGKPKSKRVPVRLRHKIEKASAAKQRKQRKEAKKNPQWRSRLKKDPGVPNLFPYKAKVLAELEEQKRRNEEEVRRKRDLAKAQREGKSVVEGPVTLNTTATEQCEDELLDESGTSSSGDEMEGQEDSNPLAALLASAQARAQTYDAGKDGEDEEDDDDDEEEEDDGGVAVARQTVPTSTSSGPEKKALPKKALEDPIKAVSVLVQRMQKTEAGMQLLLDHYRIPPLVTAGSDANTRFLVEVARKRGRLGRGGVPNLHSAALIVLGDLNEQRLVLPADSVRRADEGRSEVRIVDKLAEPFRIEGLWGDDGETAAMEDVAAE